MSGPVRNYTLAAGTAPAAANTVVFRVPLDNSAIVKHILLSNQGAASASVTCYIVDFTTNAAPVAFIQTIPISGRFEWNQWTVFNSRSYIMFGVTGASVQYWIAGALLPYGGAPPYVTQPPGLSLALDQIVIHPLPE